MADVVIRETTPADVTQVLALYPLAFPEEDLRPVVQALLEQETGVLSLAGFEKGALASHVLFSFCRTEDQGHAGALLAPLGVLPTHQRQGLGDALVRDGLARLEAIGVKQVFVLGDPAYYQRFGFSTERQVLPPYPLPKEYGEGPWQSLSLAGNAPLKAGRLSLPAPWMKPELW